jgi:hypothetical protein
MESGSSATLYLRLFPPCVCLHAILQDRLLTYREILFSAKPSSAETTRFPGGDHFAPERVPLPWATCVHCSCSLNVLVFHRIALALTKAPPSHSECRDSRRDPLTLTFMHCRYNAKRATEAAGTQAGLRGMGNRNGQFDAGSFLADTGMARTKSHVTPVIHVEIERTLKRTLPVLIFMRRISPDYLSTISLSLFFVQYPISASIVAAASL